MEPKAKVDVDVNAKTVTIESAASEDSIKQVIVAAGYAVEGYRSASNFSQKLIYGKLHLNRKFFTL